MVSSDYTNVEDKTIIYALGTLGANYSFVNGDEFLYVFLGKNSAYSMDFLIHEDDRQDFYDAVAKLGEGRQHIVVRMKNYNQNYRLVHIGLCHNGLFMDGFESIDFVLDDVMCIQDSYVNNVFKLRKYRKYMELNNNCYFEYDFNTDDFLFYKYRNSKYIEIGKFKLSEKYAEIEKDSRWNLGDKSSFASFYDNVKQGFVHFDITLNSSMFEFEGYSGQCRIIGGKVYKNDTDHLAIGVILYDDIEEKEVYYMSEASKDSGTGLLNKRGISEYAIEQIKNAEHPMYIALIDLDDFKQVNDRYGHLFGDEVLMKVADILRNVIGNRGMAGRFGGDEFFIVFDKVQDEESLRVIIKTICKHAMWAYMGEVSDFKITFSIGIAKFPDDGNNYDHLFKIADKSLYIAKAKGKNRFIIYDEAKHGAIDSDDNNGRIVGVKAAVSNEKKQAALSQIILDLHEHGSKALDDAFKKIQAFFDIDGVSIYAGVNFDRIKTVGKYIGAIDSYIPMKTIEYQSLFNENGCYAENNSKKLEMTFPEVSALLEKQETRAFIQIFYKVDDKIEMMISFDMFNRTNKWSETDLGLLAIVGKLILSVLYSERK